MKSLQRLLENWIYGLLGFEEQTFMVSRNLVKELIDKGFTGFKSELVNYPSGETYRFDLNIEKVEHNPPKKVEPVPVQFFKNDKCKNRCKYNGDCMFKGE